MEITHCRTGTGGIIGSTAKPADSSECVRRSGPSDPVYAGAGYGKKNRPDLFNTSFLIEALRSVGNGADDPVIARALILGKHYTFKENPGMGDAGLFYYFHTAAKALDVLGEDSFTDAEGIAHNWRSELADAILAKQQPDGSWINTNPRWMEGDANLVTGYALLALTYCSPR